MDIAKGLYDVFWSSLQREYVQTKKLSKKREKISPRLNEIGNTNTKGVSWRSCAGVMIPRHGWYQSQPISDRCLLRLSGQGLRASTQQHISFRLVGAIKVGRGPLASVLFWSLLETFHSWVLPCHPASCFLIENITSKEFYKDTQSLSLKSFLWI